MAYVAWCMSNTDIHTYIHRYIHTYLHVLFTCLSDIPTDFVFVCLCVGFAIFVRTGGPSETHPHENVAHEASALGW